MKILCTTDPLPRFRRDTLHQLEGHLVSEGFLADEEPMAFHQNRSELEPLTRHYGLASERIDYLLGKIA
jgi:hypothetical protein